MITYSFPPAGGVGVMRASSLARYLPQNGIDVEVLTARNAASVGVDQDLLRSIPKEVKVHRTYAPDLPFAIRRGVRLTLSALMRKDKTLTSSEKHNEFAGRFLSPDPQMLWCPSALGAAKKIIIGSDVKCVLITVPPFSMLTLAESLRQSFPDLVIVLDFRDEWLVSYFDRLMFNNSKKALARAESIERLSIKAADLVVMVTNAARDAMRARYPAVDQSKFQVISNGYDQQRINKLSSIAKMSKVSFCYLGTIYEPASPTTLCEALHEIEPRLQSTIDMLFVGYIDRKHYRRELERLSPMVRLKGFVPQREGYSLLQVADFALLVWHDTINVPAKFYDYLGSQKPILALVHPQSEVARLVKETNCGFIADIRYSTSIAELITYLVLNRDEIVSNFAPNLQAVRNFSRDVLTSRYAKLLYRSSKETRVEADGLSKNATASN